MVYSSVLVSVESDKIFEIITELRNFKGVDVLDNKDGKVALVIESDNTEGLASIAEEIRQIENITGVEIISHFFEEEAFNKS